MFVTPEEYVAVPAAERAEKCIEVVTAFAHSAAEKAGLSLKLRDNKINRDDFNEVAQRAINDGALIVNPEAAGLEDVLAILNAAY